MACSGRVKQPQCYRQARLRHAHRLASDLLRNWTRDDLMRLEPADILDGHADLLLERNKS